MAKPTEEKTPLTQDLVVLLDEYRCLLAEVDDWFTSCLDAGDGVLSCREGCSACCRALFDINLVDAWLLQEAFAGLPRLLQQQVRQKCLPQVEELRRRWPTLAPPYFLNPLPEDEWMDMPESDQTPCPLLGEDGRCLVYESRPLICRLHGLPHIDVSGEDLEGVVCSLHSGDPRSLPASVLHWRFKDTFHSELKLFRGFAGALTGGRYRELDTFIPLVLMSDYRGLDWLALEL